MKLCMLAVYLLTISIIPSGYAMDLVDFKKLVRDAIQEESPVVIKRQKIDDELKKTVKTRHSTDRNVASDEVDNEISKKVVTEYDQDRTIAEDEAEDGKNSLIESGVIKRWKYDAEEEQDQTN